MTLEETLRSIVREELHTLEQRLEQRLARPPEQSTAPRLMKVADVARACGVTQPTVINWIHALRLRARRAGRRWVIATEDLEQFLAHDDATHATIEPGKHLRVLMDRVQRAAGGE